MQTVINISDEIYNDLVLTGENTINLGALLDLRKAVKNGTPLPKGHGRLIDADNIISKICGNSCGCNLEECGYDESCFSVARIELAETIIDTDESKE